MKRLVFIAVIICAGITIQAQDFSYLKEIDITNTSQYDEAEEAAMECCCYLVGVRYDKKDAQRDLATTYVSKWLNARYEQEYSLENTFTDDLDIADMYMVYFAMNYIDNKDEAQLSAMQAEALIGVVNYCSNTSNKLKMSKELKEIKKLIDDGTLEQSISNSALITSID